MKKALAAAAAVVAAGAAAIVPGAAHASTAPGWNRIFQGPSTGYVSSVDPISATNIWEASVLTSGDKTLYQPDVLHYNGSTWSKVTIPGAAISSTRVQSTGKNNVWVFGGRDTSGVESDAAYRWNGSAWTRISVPARTYLQGTVVLGPWNVWAFGGSASMPGDIFHWTGSGWKAYDTNYSFRFAPESIAASSASNIWIAGTTGGNSPKLVAYHWNGSHWYKSAAPQPTVASTPSVAVLSGSNVWIGWATSTTQYAYHYNGTGWVKVTAPASVYANSSALVPDGRGGVWWGPFADLDGTTWTSTDSVSPDYDGGGFGPVASIPGTSSAVMGAGVINPGSSVEHPTIYRLNF